MILEIENTGSGSLLADLVCIDLTLFWRPEKSGFSVNFSFLRRAYGLFSTPEGELMDIKYLRFWPHSKHSAALWWCISIAFTALIDWLGCFLPKLPNLDTASGIFVLGLAFKQPNPGCDENVLVFLNVCHSITQWI